MLDSVILDVGYGIFLLFMLVLSWVVFGVGVTHYQHFAQPYYYHMSVVMLGVGMIVIFLSAMITVAQIWMPDPLPVMNTTWRLILSGAHAWAIIGAVSVCSVTLSQTAARAEGAATVSVMFIAVASTYLCVAFRGCEQDALVSALSTTCCRSRVPEAWIKHSKTVSSANDRLLRGSRSDEEISLEDLRAGPGEACVDREAYVSLARDVLHDVNAWMSA